MLKKTFVACLLATASTFSVSDDGPLTFAQLQSTAVNTTPSQAAMPSTTDTAALKAMTKYRQQHRRTVSGHLCAAAFVRDNQIYTDCTAAKNPDGGVGREWCYVEHQLMGRVKGGWDYCAPTIDYDKVRARAREAFASKAEVVRRTIQKLELESQRVSAEIQVFDLVCGAEHSALGEQLTKIEKLVTNSKRSLTQVQSLTKKIEDSKLELAAANATYALAFREGKSSQYNCAAFPGYAEEVTPDGLKARYYNNPLFRGEPALTRTDIQVNFDYHGRDPAPGIAHPAYSIRWDGYLMVPETGVYRFLLEADCAARVFVNGQNVFTSGMEATTSPSEDEVQPLSPMALGQLKKHKETRIGLNAGDIVKIRAEAVHSSHAKHEEADVAFFRLKWEKNGHREIIPQEYLYTQKP